MIEAHQLTKRYGDKTAVGDLSFTSRSALRSTSAGRRDQEPAANRRRTHARPSGIACIEMYAGQPYSALGCIPAEPNGQFEQLGGCGWRST